MSSLVTAIIAGLVMCFEDIFGTFLVQAEARGAENLAGLMDTIGWFCNLICYGSAIDSIAKHGVLAHQTIEIVIFVSLANFFSTKYSTRFGYRHIRGLVKNEKSL